MSMVGNYLRVTSAELNEYLRDSLLLEERIYNDAHEIGDPNLTDIDKAWDGILFLLTGNKFDELSGHPLAKLFFSGQLIDPDRDMGYGPAQYLKAIQVKELNREISVISPEELRKRYDGAKMNELDIYPNSWEDERMLDYLMEYFQIVQSVFAEAAVKDEAMITFLN